LAVNVGFAGRRNPLESTSPLDSPGAGVSLPDLAPIQLGNRIAKKEGGT
jgi:hypothetical protein